MPAGQGPAPGLHAYSPPPYLVRSTGLDHDDIIAQYDAFRGTLHYADKAPELIFERLLTAASGIALDEERAKLVAAQEQFKREMIALKSEIESLTAALKVEKGRKVSIPSIPASPAVIPVAQAPSPQIYLQFWFTAFKNDKYIFNKHDTSSVSVAHATTTTTPVPYGTSSGWPEMDCIRDSRERGNYDSRMDIAITKAHLPTTVMRNIRFKTAFPSLPKVAVWLAGLSAAIDSPVSVSVMANSVTETGFVLQLSSVGGSALTSAGVSWAAWPDGTPAARVGSCSTVKPGSLRLVQLEATGDLGRGVDAKNPFTALCAVDMVLGRDVWVRVSMRGSPPPSAYSYSSQGPTWNFAAGPADARVYSARVTYVAQ